LFSTEIFLLRFTTEIDLLVYLYLVEVCSVEEVAVGGHLPKQRCLSVCLVQPKISICWRSILSAEEAVVFSVADLMKF
jgi:hypothetical protein